VGNGEMILLNNAENKKAPFCEAILPDSKKLFFRDCALFTEN
jgi:hypothetical protein